MGDRRTPIIAAVAVVVALLLAIFFLVLPKMSQVSSANDELDQAISQQATLQSQLAALRQAEQDAPEARETIRKVDQAIPPTVDQQGLILLLQNAADQSAVDLFTITPATPAFDAATGLTSVPAGLVVNGSYFAITEFLFFIETLPRAAKVSSLTLAPAAGGLAATATVTLFTTDQSAGPGSSPGPTSTGGVTTVPAAPASPSPAPAVVVPDPEGT